MVKITKKTDYGLTLLGALADKPEELQSLRSISETYGLPYKFIGQVAAALLEAGIVTSKEGATGGYRLSKAPKDISLQQVMDVLDGPSVKADCLRGIACPRASTCSHQHIICAIADTVRASLVDKSLADIVSKPKS